MSMMVSFVLSFFPRDVLDEILNLIESVSEDFPSYSSIKDTTSNSQVNSCFPYRWPPASLTLNIYFTYICIFVLFLYYLMQSEIIIYGLVRKCVKLSPFSQTIFILDLALNYIDKL